jgi:hypothetical protein
LNNGELLKMAEEAGFEKLLTTEHGMRYQQNLADRKIAIVVLTGTTKWSQVGLHSERIAEAVDAAVPGSFVEVSIPFEKKPHARNYNQ